MGIRPIEMKGPQSRARTREPNETMDLTFMSFCETNKNRDFDREEKNLLFSHDPREDIGETACAHAVLRGRA